MRRMKAFCPKVASFYSLPAGLGKRAAIGLLGCCEAVAVSRRVSVAVEEQAA